MIFRPLRRGPPKRTLSSLGGKVRNLARCSLRPVPYITLLADARNPTAQHSPVPALLQATTPPIYPPPQAHAVPRGHARAVVLTYDEVVSDPFRVARRMHKLMRAKTDEKKLKAFVEQHFGMAEGACAKVPSTRQPDVNGSTHVGVEVCTRTAAIGSAAPGGM